MEGYAFGHCRVACPEVMPVQESPSIPGLGRHVQSFPDKMKVVVLLSFHWRLPVADPVNTRGSAAGHIFGGPFWSQQLDRLPAGPRRGSGEIHQGLMFPSIDWPLTARFLCSYASLFYFVSTKPVISRE